MNTETRRYRENQQTKNSVSLRLCVHYNPLSTMKKNLVFATNNAHKLEEIRAILGDKINILSLNDIDCHADIPETADTLEGNARLKAEYIYQHYGMDCFADDTGLEVEALNGAPGIYSARYAGGAGHDSEANMRKLLPICANYSPNWKEKPTGKPSSALPSASSKEAKNIYSKASCAELSYKKDVVQQALAMTLSSNPKATLRHLPKWKTKKRTKSATVPVPCRS